MDVFEYLFNNGEMPKKLPKHNFFKSDRWGLIGSCSSFYFVPDAVSKLCEANHTGRRTLVTRSDLKNYGDEINLFIDWATPFFYGEYGDHIGHYRYEEDDEPTILYLRGNNA
jgi:hypothetical protein